MEDTIAAIATPSGSGAIGILRISGKGAREVAAAVLRSDAGEPPDLRPEHSHRARRAKLVDPRSDEVLDEVLFIAMWAPRSYTGEDVVEIQGHGGSVLSRAAIGAALAAGARTANPGEFTQRAFLNGRIDLCQAEAVADLIGATSESGLKAAARQLGGQLSARLLALRERILDARAIVEAYLDFPEEDLPDGVEAETLGLLAETRAEIDALAASFARGRLVREGVSVVLAGRPNVGKSSLLNALAARDVAIVTDIAGTTRDTISVPVDLGGFLVNFVDTAGLRETSDTIEALGVDRARQAAEQADLVLCLVDERGEAPEIAASLDQARVLRVATKQDLWRASPDTTGQQAAPLGVSVVTGEGLQAVLDAVQAAVLGQGGSLDALLPMGRERHAFHVGAAVAALQQAQAQDELALLAECMREASAALGRITGAVDVEDVLDHIFSRFCIGK